MGIKNRNGQMLSGEFVNLALSAIGIIILFLLSVAIYNAFFESRDETSKSYLEFLEEEISNARNEGGGEFFIWNIDSKEGSEYYLVYFGKRLVVSYGGIDFISKGEKNTACICLVESEASYCNSCKSFGKPLIFDGSTDGFVIPRGDRYVINYEGGSYAFKTV
ncbi:MAG: hypothetical protein IH845_05060 [Nanoarchaeota archaeon]|nr:hypothetical protein [Nanoarchaeota archaeon]